MNILEIISKNPSAVNQITQNAIDEKTNFYISVFLAVLSLIIGVIVACWIYVIEEKRKRNDKENELKRYKEGLKSEEQQRLYNHDLDVFDRALESGFNKIFILGVNALSTLHKGRERIIKFINQSRNNHVYIFLLDPKSINFRKRVCTEIEIDVGTNFNSNNNRYNAFTRELESGLNNNNNQNHGPYNEEESKIASNYARLIREFQASLSLIEDIQKQLGTNNGNRVHLKVHDKEPSYAFTASYCFDRSQRDKDSRKKGIAWINIYRKNERGLTGGQFLADREKEYGNKLYNEFVSSIFVSEFEDDDKKDIPKDIRYYDIMIERYNRGEVNTNNRLPEIMKW